MNVAQSASDCPAITEMAATREPLGSTGKHVAMDLTRVSWVPAPAVLRAAAVVSK